MRSFYKSVALAAIMFTATASYSCSDDDPVVIDPEIPEVPENNPEDKPGDKPGDNTGGDDSGVPGISEEYLELIRSVYGAATTGPQEVRTVSQLSIITAICATLDGKGPITVTPATLNGEDITLVTLGGTQDVEGQATTMKESQLASFGKPNDYLTAVTRLFDDGTIPASKPVVVTGYSLGGMIAQQIPGVPEILESHDIRAIITFGSPITLPLDRKGIRVVRFADTNDGVPRMGESILRNGMVPVGSLTKDELTAKLNELDKNEKVSRTGKYTDFLVTHALSYIEDECWNDVDFLGDASKKNVMVLTKEMTFYPAPKIN